MDKGKQKFITEFPNFTEIPEFEALRDTLKRDFGIYVYDDPVSDRYQSENAFIVSDVELSHIEVINISQQKWETELEKQL